MTRHGLPRAFKFVPVTFEIAGTGTRRISLQVFAGDEEIAAIRHAVEFPWRLLLGLYAFPGTVAPSGMRWPTSFVRILFAVRIASRRKSGCGVKHAQVLFRLGSDLGQEQWRPIPPADLDEVFLRQQVPSQLRLTVCADTTLVRSRSLLDETS